MKGLNKKSFPICLTLFVCWSVSGSHGCSDGENSKMGASLELFKKNSQSSSHYTESEVTNLISLLSKNFTHISLYATDDENSLDSRLPLAVAKANSQNSNEIKISVLAALQNQDEIPFEISLDKVLSKIKESNKIYPGTVTGLIVSSTDMEDLRSFRYEDIPEITEDNSQAVMLELVSKFPQAISFFTTLPNLVKIAKDHKDAKALSVGIRSGNCAELQRLIMSPLKDNSELTSILDDFTKVFTDLDFLICLQLPTESSTPEDTATSLIENMKDLIQFYNKRWPKLMVSFETGWPFEGNTINGTEGEYSSRDEFWCEIDKWSKINSVNVDFQTPYFNTQISNTSPRNSPTTGLVIISTVAGSVLLSLLAFGKLI